MTTPTLLSESEFPPIHIEHGIAVPEHRRRDGTSRTGRLREALQTMQVGQSFVCPWTPELVYRLAREVNIKITTVKLNGCGRRVWRIA